MYLSGLLFLAVLASPIFLSFALPLGGDGHQSSVSPEHSITNEEYGGIHVPNPSVSIGVPSARRSRSYLTGGLQIKQRRRPEAGDLSTLPGAATDAVQPHKAPVSDSAVTAVENTNHHQQQDQNSAPQSDSQSPDKDESDWEWVDNEDNTSGYEPSSSGNEINAEVQNMASSASATPSPIPYSENGGQATSKGGDPYSLSHSLGTISHSQFEDEDRGKAKRAGIAKRAGRKYPRKSLNSSDEEEPPTIWNGKVSIDDLDWWEQEELYKDLAYLNHMLNTPSARKQPGKPFNATNSHNSTTPSDLLAPFPTDSSSAATRPYKSTADAFGLITHVLFRNKQHRGHKRNGLHNTYLEDRGAGSEKMKRLDSLAIAPSDQNDSSKLRRDDMYKYPDPVDTKDISDTAYEEFRQQYPAFFGGGRTKE